MFIMFFVKSLTQSGGPMHRFLYHTNCIDMITLAPLITGRFTVKLEKKEGKLEGNDANDNYTDYTCHRVCICAGHVSWIAMSQ